MKKTKSQDRLQIVRSEVKTFLTSSETFQSLPSAKRRKMAQDTIKIATYLVSDASSGGDTLVAGVDFPGFVSGLLNGVFDEIVDSSIRQMEAYAKLVAAVAKSLDEFANENVSDNEARDHLRETFPKFFRSSTKPKRRRVQLASKRQQLLATMVLMGINQIVVTDGRITSRVIK